jgi:hypothetical protein
MLNLLELNKKGNETIDGTCLRAVDELNLAATMPCTNAGAKHCATRPMQQDSAARGLPIALKLCT